MLKLAIRYARYAVSLLATIGFLLLLTALPSTAKERPIKGLCAFPVLAIGTFRYFFDAKGNLVQLLVEKGQLIDVCRRLT